MPLHFRCDGEIAILSSFGRLMNDPRYIDASQQVRHLLSDGFRAFVIDLRGVGGAGSPLLGLLATITRQIRQDGGEVVLAGVSPGLEKFLGEMRMQEFWDVFPNVEETKQHFVRPKDAPRGNTDIP